MKYFEIFQETDSKIIGTYPQVKNLRIDFQKARASQWGIISQWKTEDDIPDLHNFLFQQRAKLTDILSNNFVQISSGLLISEKGKQVLEQFKINGTFYSAIVYKNEKEYQYYLLRFGDIISKISFKKSEFIEYNINTLCRLPSFRTL